MTTDLQQLLRLQTWLSPAFPVGGYSYSHGLEAAIEAGYVGDAESLQAWLAGDIEFGAGRMDVQFLAASWRATMAADWEELAEVGELAAAMRGTSELQLESYAQGRAFINTVRQVWPSKGLKKAMKALDDVRETMPLSVAVGTASAIEDLPLEAVAVCYLQAQYANLVSAGIRAIPLGQTAGQQVIAALEPLVNEVAARALEESLDDVGSASVMVDILSMQHEVQYSRIYRS